MEATPRNQDTDPRYNQEPGIAYVSGSPYAKEMAKFEQFHSQITAAAGVPPGNAYTYRPFPKMVYRARRYNGAVTCMAAPPDAYEFKDNREYERAEAAARKFTEECQLVVKDETEYARAMEAGYRESPAEAVEHVIARDRAEVKEVAHRLHDDRHISEPAQREVAAIEAAAGDPLPEIPVQPRKRGRPRKTV